MNDLRHKVAGALIVIARLIMPNDSFGELWKKNEDSFWKGAMNAIGMAEHLNRMGHVQRMCERCARE